MHISTLVNAVEREEIDYPLLLSLLADYKFPRDKISEWLKKGDLIRVKKGLYVFGRHIAKSPYSLEILSNLIYGPSAISLTYALSWYGLIPERPVTITSITPKRNKQFLTPVGEFTYQYLTLAKYSIGITLADIRPNKQFLIASPEKALCDHLFLTDKIIQLITLDDIEHYLLDDLRIDESQIPLLRSSHLLSIAKSYKDPRLTLLYDFIKKWKS